MADMGRKLHHNSARKVKGFLRHNIEDKVRVLVRGIKEFRNREPVR